MKMGADTGFLDCNNVPIRVGDKVRHTLTGVIGVVSQYGTIKSEDGQSFKNANKYWMLLPNDEPIDIEIKDELGKTVMEGQVKEESNDLAETYKKIEEEARKEWKVTEDAETGEAKVEVFSEKILADYSDDELLDEVRKRKCSVRDLAEHGIRIYGISEAEDQTLADELRRRGFEVTAKKVVEVCL